MANMDISTAIPTYLAEVRALYASGQSTEHSFRPALFTRQSRVVILRGAKRSRRIHEPHGCCDYAQHDVAGMFNA